MIADDPAQPLVHVEGLSFRYLEAEKVARGAFEVQLRNLGPQNPDTVDTLRQLGAAMTYDHRYPEAAKLFRNVIEKGTETGGHGNTWLVWDAFAAVAAAANRPDEAMQYLHEAVNHGYNDADALAADDDLKPLHQNPKFQKLIAQLRQSAKITAH